MAATSIVACRIFESGQATEAAEARIRWNGPQGVVARVGIPASLRPEVPVTVEGLALAPSATPIRLTWDSPEILCEWHSTGKPVDTGSGFATVFHPSSSSERCWNATFSLRQETEKTVHRVFPKIRVERMPVAPWFASVAAWISGAAAVLAIAAAAAIIGLGWVWAAPVMLSAALVAGVVNPLVLRLLDAHARLPLPREPELLGTLVLPGITVESETRRSEILDNPVVIQYRRRVAEEITRLHIIESSGPDRIDTDYVPIRLRVRRAARILRSTSHDSHTKVEQLIGSDPRLARIFDDAKLLPDQAWNRYPHLTIVGGPGAGKTATIRWLTRMLADGPLQNRDSVPVYIELHRYARRKGIARSPLDALRSAIIYYMLDTLHSGAGNTATEEVSREDVERVVDGLIESGELTLLLDGLDEIDKHAGRSSRVVDHVIAAISAASESWTGVRIIVSCKQSALDRYRRLPRHFTVAETEPFDRAAIEAFAKKHFTASPEQAVQLLYEIDRYPRVRVLAGRPLMLALMARIFEQRGTVPQRCSEVFRLCTGILLQEWDPENTGDRPHKRFLLEHVNEFLRRFAWELHSRECRFMDRSAALALVQGVLDDAGLAEEKAELLLDTMVSGGSVIRQHADGWYGFAHFSLQVFYAAENMSREEALQTAIEQRHRSWWQDVLRLSAGREECAGAMLRLLNEREDCFRTNLRLAAGCLIEHENIDPELRDAALGELLSVAESTHVPALSQRLWRLLIREGGPDAAEAGWRAISDHRVPMSVRTAIIHEMAQWLDDTCAREALDRLTDDTLPVQTRVELVSLAATSGDLSIHDELLAVSVDSNIDDAVRAAAIDRLAVPGQETMIPAFADLMFERSTPFEVRRAVARGLHRMGRTEVIDRVLGILNDWQIDVALRASLAGVAGELVAAGTLSRLVDTLCDTRIPASVRTSLAVSLKGREIGVTCEGLIGIVRDMQTDYSVRLAIADVLSSVVTPVHRASLSELHAEGAIEESIGLRVAIALGAVGETSMLGTINSIISDSTARPFLRLEAARVLGSFKMPEVCEMMLRTIDSRAVDPFGQELAVLVLDLQRDPSLAGPLIDRLSNRSLPLSARLRMVNTFAALDARPLVGRVVSLLTDRNFTVQLRGRLALALTGVTDARDTGVLERIMEILPQTKEIPEIATLAWHLSEQTGQPVFPESIDEEPIRYDWAQESAEETEESP